MAGHAVAVDIHACDSALEDIVFWGEHPKCDLAHTVLVAMMCQPCSLVTYGIAHRCGACAAPHWCCSLLQCIPEHDTNS